MRDRIGIRSSRMVESSKAKLTSAARATSAPLRNYFNNHFEMTKEEVRRIVQQIGELDKPGQSASTLELSNVVAETALFQSQMIAETREEIIDMRTQIQQLSALVDRLVSVIGAMNDGTQHPDLGSASDA